MKNYIYLSLRDNPKLEDKAASWFCEKWNIDKATYLKCMEDYLNNNTEYGWYLCILDDEIVGGLGVIENDFHNRKDLSPNICAVYTEKEHRGNGIAGHLLNMAVEDLRSKKISPVYLITNHTNFYERYGFEFLCMAKGDNDSFLSRVYIHR